MNTTPVLSLDWPHLVVPTYLLCGLFVFLLYGADKHFAAHGRWRIAERTLLLAALLPGGAIGALAGMRFFRHKTRKWYFWVVNAVLTLVQIALLVFLVGGQ